MNDAEVKFCATLMAAARKCGMGMNCEQSGDTTRYFFVDPMVHLRIAGPAEKDKKSAVHGACLALQNYFNGGK